MSAGGDPPPPLPPPLFPPPSLPSLLGKPPFIPPKFVSNHSKSWANIVAPEHTLMEDELSPLLHKDSFEALKSKVHDRLILHDTYASNMAQRMQNSFYGKFLGKALPLDQLRFSLNNVWKTFGEFSVADLPNGYYFFKCSSAEMAGQLIAEGPWTISGMVLQLIPWRPNFQPAFERLSSAAIWVQIHHLPMELWTGDILEDLAGRIGRLVKIDELTLSASRARFARVCVELDLGLPLKTGIWVGPKDDQALAVLTYERLPTFCFSCGCVGHGAGSCKSSLSSRPMQLPPSEMSASASASAAISKEAVFMQLDGAGNDVGTDLEPTSQLPPLEPQGEASVLDESFGNWMVVRRRRGRGSGRRSPEFSSSNHQERNADAWPAPLSDEGQVDPISLYRPSRGRGGRVGPSRFDFSSSRADQGAKGHLHLKGLSIPMPPPSVISPSGKLALESDGSRNSLASPPSLPVSGLFKGKGVSSSDAPVLNPSGSDKSLFASSSSPKETSVLLPLPFLSPPSCASVPVILSSLPRKDHQDGMQVEKPGSSILGHSALVDKVTQALCPSHPVLISSGPRSEADGGEEESMKGSVSSGDFEDDSTLLSFQKDFKVQARREARRAKSGKIKGRSSNPY